MTKSDSKPGVGSSWRLGGWGVGIALLAAAMFIGLCAPNKRPEEPSPAPAPVRAPDVVRAPEPTSKQEAPPSPTVEDARLYMPMDLEGAEVESVGFPGDVPNTEKEARITLRPIDGPGTVIIMATQGTTPIEKMGGKNPVWVTVDGAKAYQSTFGSGWATTWTHGGLILRVTFENLGSSDVFLKEQSLAFANMVADHAKRVQDMTAQQKEQLLRRRIKK